MQRIWGETNINDKWHTLKFRTVLCHRRHWLVLVSCAHLCALNISWSTCWLACDWFDHNYLKQKFLKQNFNWIVRPIVPCADHSTQLIPRLRDCRHWRERYSDQMAGDRRRLPYSLSIDPVNLSLLNEFSCIPSVSSISIWKWKPSIPSDDCGNHTQSLVQLLFLETNVSIEICEFTRHGWFRQRFAGRSFDFLCQLNLHCDRNSH